MTDDELREVLRADDHLYNCPSCNKDWAFWVCKRDERGRLICPGEPCGYVFQEKDIRRGWGIAFQHMRDDGDE